MSVVLTAAPLLAPGSPFTGLNRLSPTTAWQPTTTWFADTLIRPDSSKLPGNNPQHPTGLVLGVLVDSTTHQPVSFATVAVFQTGHDQPLGGTTADEQGRFVISGLAAGHYRLRISVVGYQTKQLPFSISPQQPDVQLDRVRLRPEARTLQAVEVVAQKALIEEKSDRLVYNAEKDVTAQGGNATDILRKVPLLTVDLDGNLSLRGSQNVRVLINGKPSALVTGSVADALKQIPADQIQTIEVITSPSARYDAEGSAGVVNIVLKKNTLRGFSLGLDSGLGNRGGSLSLNSGLRVGKMGFSLGGSGWLNYNIKGAFANTQTTGQTVMIQQADTRSRAQSGQYTFGWDYDLNKTNTLTTSVRFGLRNHYAVQDHLTTQLLSTGSLFPQSEVRNVVADDLSRSVDINTVYTHVFNPQQELSFLALFSRNDRLNQFTADRLSPLDLNQVIGRQRNNNPSLNGETTLQADYQTAPGRKRARAGRLLEVGLKGVFRQVSSDYAYFEDSLGQDRFVVDPRLSPNGLRYRQDVLAGYVSYTLPLPKQYTLKVGGRYEQTAIRARYSSAAATADSITGPLELPGYGNWLPNLALSKRLKNGRLLKLAYNRRLQRPGIQFLNPNLNAANPLSVTQGNPRLGPEVTHNVDISTSITVNTVFVQAALFARFTKQAIQPVRDTVSPLLALANQLASATVIRTSYRNIGQEQAYGLNLTGNGTLLTRWQLGGGLDVYYAWLSGRSMNFADRRSNAGWVLSGRLFSSVSFKKGWTLQGFGLLFARQVQWQGYQGGFSFYMLGIKKEFARKRGSVGLAAENFFNYPFRVRSRLLSTDFTQQTETSYYNAGARITFSYRFGQQSQPPAKPTRKAVQNDDVKGGVEPIDKP